MAKYKNPPLRSTPPPTPQGYNVVIGDPSDFVKAATAAGFNVKVEQVSLDEAARRMASIEGCTCDPDPS